MLTSFQKNFLTVVIPLGSLVALNRFQPALYNQLYQSLLQVLHTGLVLAIMAFIVVYIFRKVFGKKGTKKS